MLVIVIVVTTEMTGYSHLYSKLVPEWARGGVHEDEDDAAEHEADADGDDTAPTTTTSSSSSSTS
jgi:hypothetical protein